MIRTRTRHTILMGGYQPHTASRYQLRDDQSNWGEAGEKGVFLRLDALLESEWEILHQPNLNGPRPDFICIHPQHGFIIIEVKNWNIALGETTVEVREGNAPPVIRLSSGVWKEEDPYRQVLRYRNELYMRCGKRNLDEDKTEGLDSSLVRTWVVFTHQSAFDKDLLDRFLLPLDAHLGYKFGPPPTVYTAKQLFQTTSFEFLDIPKQTDESSQLDSMTHELVLMWLGIPSKREVTSFALSRNPRQTHFANERNPPKYRRIRGPAGSGKSILAVRRALRVAGEGKRVLVVCFNTTLVSHLYRMALRIAKHENLEFKLFRNIEWYHFHGWAKEMARRCNMSSRYRMLTSKINDVENGLKLGNELKEALAQKESLYDAIIVDEGQDFHLEWWNALRATKSSEGEMLLLVDRVQDLYGATKRWTQKAMKGAGFSGNWAELVAIFRMPADLIPVLRNYSRHFLKEDFTEGYEVQTIITSHLGVIRWYAVRERERAEISIAGIESHLLENRDIPRSDTIVLFSTNAEGSKATQELESDWRISHTFTNDRSVKYRFGFPTDELRMTTPYSFKGLEAASVVISTGSIVGRLRKKTLRSIFVAMSRLHGGMGRCAMTVISSDSELNVWADKQDIINTIWHCSRPIVLDEEE